MAKVLQNFLIGVGLDTEKYDKGAKNVESSLGRMRSLVGVTGAAMVGAFGAAGLAAINVANRVDKTNLAFANFKTPPAWINNYGNAISILGGHADEAVAAISTIEKAQSDFALKGMLGPLEDVALARGDINELSQTKTGEEFLRKLAGMVPQMNKDQQRLVKDSLGFSDAVMESLRGGVSKLDAAVASAGELYGEFGRATEAARGYKKAIAELDTQFQGIGETLAQKMLPPLTGILNSASDFIKESQGKTGQIIDRAAENPAATGLVVGGAATAVAGVAARGVGLQTLGRGLMRAGPYGIAAGTGLLAWDAKPEDIEGLTGYKPPSYIFEKTPVDAAKDGWEYLKSRDWWPWQGGEVKPEGNASTGTGILPLGKLNIHDNEPHEDSAARKPLPLNRLNLNESEPIYAGGEVSNDEAANASPDVIMVKDQRQQAERQAAPQRVSVQNNLEVRMELDGRALDSRITEVLERRERDTQDDIYSSVEK